MAITISCFILFLLSIIAGRLWASTWDIDTRPIRPPEPRELTNGEKYRIIEAIRDGLREEKEDDEG